MKTNLAYVDKRVGELLRAELKSPTPHREHAEQAAKPRIIAGFEVDDSAHTKGLMDKARAARREVIDTYFKNHRALTEEFKAVGVTPEAIVPTVTFKKMCQSADMYWLPKSMTTSVYPGHFMDWMRDVEDGEPTAWSRLGRPLRRYKPKKGFSVDAYLERHSHAEVMKHVLGMSEYRPSLIYQSKVDGDVQSLILPIPPKDVMAKLIACAGGEMPLRTVAVFEAVDFVGGVKALLHKALDVNLRQAEADRIDWETNDPIVYVEKGPVTAVVCQFGPFPVEKEIIDKLTAADFLPASL